MQYQSQAGQDKFVCERLSHKRGGFFIDIGAHDGVTINNTWVLEKLLGWDGICVEPCRTNFEKLVHNRECITTSVAMAGKCGTVRFKEYEGDTFAGHIDKEGNYKVKAVDFPSLLRRYQAPEEIDYISIDVEGSELDIIMSFPWDEYDVKIWSIEHASFNDGGAMRGKISSYMAEHGYMMQMVDKYGHDEGLYYK